MVGDAVSAPSPGEASVRIPTVRTARVAHVLCSASVGAPSAASGWSDASWRSAEAWVRLLLAGVMSVPGTAKRSAVPTYTGRADRGMTSALP